MLTSHRSGCRIVAPSCALLAVSIVAISCGRSAPAPARTETPPPQQRAIFNGVDLTGWDGDPRYWRVVDGCIVGETTADAPLERNTFLIYRGSDVADFELTCEYLVDSKWANSGIQYRSVEPDAAGLRWVMAGAQADIDEPVQYSGILYGERDRGILAQRGQSVEIRSGGEPQVVGSLGDAAALAAAINGKGQWNRYRIEAVGPRVIHEINGIRMIEAVDNDAPAADSASKGFRGRGLIALQLHSGPPMKIRFRSIEVCDKAPR